MGFLSFLCSLLSEAASSSESSRKAIYDSPEDKERREKRFHKVAILTLEQIEGINDRTKERIAVAFELYDPRTDSFEELCQDVSKQLEGKDWRWIEYDFWAPICLERHIATEGMHHYCRPWPDVLNLEEERKAFPAEKIAKSITVKAFKEKLQETFPDVSSIKRKAQVLEFLVQNEDALNVLADEKILDRWNKRKHNPGETTQGLIALLCRTIISRQEDLEQLEDDKGLGCKYTFSFCDEDDPVESEDHQLFNLSKKLKNKPWTDRIMPNIPGLYFDRDYL